MGGSGGGHRGIDAQERKRAAAACALVLVSSLVQQAGGFDSIPDYPPLPHFAITYEVEGEALSLEQVTGMDFGDSEKLMVTKLLAIVQVEQVDSPRQGGMAESQKNTLAKNIILHGGGSKYFTTTANTMLTTKTKADELALRKRSRGVDGTCQVFWFILCLRTCLKIENASNYVNGTLKLIDDNIEKGVLVFLRQFRSIRRPVILKIRAAAQLEEASFWLMKIIAQIPKHPLVDQPLFLYIICEWALLAMPQWKNIEAYQEAVGLIEPRKNGAMAYKLAYQLTFSPDLLFPTAKTPAAAALLRELRGLGKRMMMKKKTRANKPKPEGAVLPLTGAEVSSAAVAADELALKRSRADRAGPDGPTPEDPAKRCHFSLGRALPTVSGSPVTVTGGSVEKTTLTNANVANDTIMEPLDGPTAAVADPAQGQEMPCSEMADDTVTEAESGAPGGATDVEGEATDQELNDQTDMNVTDDDGAAAFSTGAAAEAIGAAGEDAAGEDAAGEDAAGEDAAGEDAAAGEQDATSDSGEGAMTVDEVEEDMSAADEPAGPHVADTLHKAKGKWKEEMNKEGGSHVNKYAASELIKDATNAATTPITLATVLKLLLLDYPGRDILYILTQDLEEYEQFGVPITALQAMQEQIRVVSNQIESHFGVAGDLLTFMVLRSNRVPGLQMLVNSVETKSPLDKVAAYFLETKLIMAKVFKAASVEERGLMRFECMDAIASIAESTIEMQVTADLGMIIHCAATVKKFFDLAMAVWIDDEQGQADALKPLAWGPVSWVDEQRKTFKSDAEKAKLNQATAAAAKKAAKEKRKLMPDDILPKKAFSPVVYEIYECATGFIETVARSAVFPRMCDRAASLEELSVEAWDGSAFGCMGGYTYVEDRLHMCLT
eukprot:g10850.t1